MVTKLNILVYGRFPTEKAYGIHALNQANSFHKLGNDVTIFYPSTNNQKTIHKTPEDYYKDSFDFDLKEIDFYDITNTRFFTLMPKLIKKFIWLLSSYVWSSKIKEHIKDSIVWSTNPVVLWVHRKNNKLVFEQHGQAKYIQKLFINKLKSEDSFFIGTTKKSYENLLSINKNSIYLPNAVNTDIFYPNLNKSFEKLVVGYVGMLETYGVDKGVFKSVEKLILLMNKFDFEVKIIGGPEIKLNQIKDLVSSSNFKDKFELINRLNQREAANLMRSLDIGIVPYPDETHMNMYASPLKIFEYTACGVVSLVSDLDSHKELRNLNLQYFKKDNFESFYEEMEKLLSNKVELKKIYKNIINLNDELSLETRNSKLLKFMRL